MIEALLLNLNSHDKLTQEETDLLSSIFSCQRQVVTGEDIVPEGSRPGVSSLLVDGFAARYK